MGKLKPIAFFGLSLLIIFFGILILGEILPGSRPLNKSKFTELIKKMSVVRDALKKYKQEYGGFPERLSDLIPQFINPQNIDVFYAENSKCIPPIDWKTDANLVNSSSIYNYRTSDLVKRKILLQNKKECFSEVLTLRENFGIDSQEPAVSSGSK